MDPLGAGVSYYRQPVTKENIAAALACWMRALALDPNSASLNAMVGYCYVVDARFGWRDERKQLLQRRERTLIEHSS